MTCLIEQNIKRGEEMLTLSRPTEGMKMNTCRLVKWKNDKLHFKHDYLGVIICNACV